MKKLSVEMYKLYLTEYLVKEHNLSELQAQHPDECSPAALHSGCGYVCFDGVKQNFS